MAVFTCNYGTGFEMVINAGHVKAGLMDCRSDCPKWHRERQALDGRDLRGVEKGSN